jgi:uncharacterized membrane protein
MTAKSDTCKYSTRSAYLGRNKWSGILFGIGLAAFVDETVFHQLLHWHHFYDRSTTDIGLITDGLLHSFSWFATVGGLFIFADLRRRKALWLSSWWGGVLLGSGGFHLYDGIVQHKILRLHQIRYVDNVLIYDLVWNIIAVLLIIAGITLIVRGRSSKQQKENVSHEH